MTDRFTWATDQIALLGRDAASESVRLSALRSILADMMAVSEYSGMAQRLTDMEERLDERDREASSMRYPAAKYGSGAAASATPPATTHGNGAG
jgi:hypothetical protein